MDFIKPLGITEIIIISAFFIFYLLYLIRLNSINKKIKVYKRKVLFKLLLRSIYFFLLIISLLGPSFGDNKQEVNVVGKDIMILVDLSESMNAFIDSDKSTRIIMSFPTTFTSCLLSPKDGPNNDMMSKKKYILLNNNLNNTFLL